MRGRFLQSIEFLAVVGHHDAQRASEQHSGVVARVAGDQHVLWSESPLPEYVPHRKIASAADRNDVEIHSQRHDNFSTQSRFAKDLLDLAGVGAYSGIDFVADLEFRLMFVVLREKSRQLVQHLADLVRLPGIADRLSPTPVRASGLRRNASCVPTVRIDQVGTRQSQFLDQRHGAVQSSARRDAEADMIVALESSSTNSASASSSPVSVLSRSVMIRRSNSGRRRGAWLIRSTGADACSRMSVEVTQVSSWRDCPTNSAFACPLMPLADHSFPLFRFGQRSQQGMFDRLAVQRDRPASPLRQLAMMSRGPAIVCRDDRQPGRSRFQQCQVRMVR